MYVVDMHCDSLLAVNAENGLISKYNYSKKHPQLQFFAEFVPNEGRPPEVRRKELMRYLDMYIAETQRLKLVKVSNCHDLNFAIEFDRRASLLSVEGGGGLFADSEELNTLYKVGLRVLGLAWDNNELSTCAWDTTGEGITKAGFDMISRCSELGIIMDVSHLSDRAFYELYDATPYPILATHSNFRDVCDCSRNLTLDMAQKIARRGGVIGLNLCPSFVRADGKPDREDLYRHIDYALDKLGEDVLSFGFDIDGTDSEYPRGIDESSSIHDNVIELLERKYNDRIVEKIAGLNAINFFKNNI